jgi:hypothetical protein
MTPLEQQTRTEAVVHCAIIDLLDGREPKRPLTLEQREFFRKEMRRLSHYLDTDSPAEAK